MVRRILQINEIYAKVDLFVFTLLFILFLTVI